jgi:hypothetical protein
MAQVIMNHPGSGSFGTRLAPNIPCFSHCLLAVSLSSTELPYH